MRIWSSPVFGNAGGGDLSATGFFYEPDIRKEVELHLHTGIMASASEAQLLNIFS